MSAPGPVDRYLDEMFDLLAGTGADGRRLLTEAEEHLTEAAAEGRARGLDAEAAEREAVDRFGSAAVVAGGVPARGAVRAVLPRLAIAAWALIGTALIWYGLSGVLVRLLSWPWTRLLIATDRFGADPMCGFVGYPAGVDDCVRVYRPDFMVFFPGVDNSVAEFAGPIAHPDLVLTGLGAALLITLLVWRRGAGRWMPSPVATGRVFAGLFGLAAVGLVIEAVDGVFKNVQNYVLADFVAALVALLISAVALRRAVRARATRRGDPGPEIGGRAAGLAV
ncbi:hypothetical protein [Actinoplanes sp. NPDC049265]|uniref:hypothetical protein n=1 Tax=Actinoplanes sp. NPDC049265 TaxID=3363902 RepID=UPI00371BD33D